MSACYRLIRSDRRTLALSIDETGALIARAPLRMPAREVEGFIRQKEAWIAKKQAEVRARAESRQSFALVEGAALPCLGGTLRLHFEDVPAATEQNGVLTLPITRDARACIRAFLAAKADAELAPRVAHWARVMRCAPKKLMWSTAKKRWGSMRADGILRLNLALMHCPMDAVDYVIVHELAHLFHPDHSPAFHACVRRFLPDADERRKRMSALSHCLTLLDGGTRA